MSERTPALPGHFISYSLGTACFCSYGYCFKVGRVERSETLLCRPLLWYFELLLPFQKWVSLTHVVVFDHEDDDLKPHPQIFNWPVKTKRNYTNKKVRNCGELQIRVTQPPCTQSFPHMETKKRSISHLASALLCVLPAPPPEGATLHPHTRSAASCRALFKHSALIQSLA